jgi:hypothetical protein
MIKIDKNKVRDLVEGNISLNDFEIDSIKIDQNFRVIPKEEINDIYIINPENDGYNFENSDFTIAERIEMLEKLNGYIHLAGGLNCRIENKKIVDLRLSRKYIEFVKEYTKQQVFDYHGKPTFELIDDMAFGGFDYSIENYILVYETKRISFYFDPNSLKLKEINTNKLNYKCFTVEK